MSTGARPCGHRTNGTGKVELRNGSWWWAPPRNPKEQRTPRFRGPYDYKREAWSELQGWHDENGTGVKVGP